MVIQHQKVQLRIQREHTRELGDSFMGAFGMGDSSIVSGGESGGGVTAGLTAVELSAAHVGSTSLTSSQNTPYSYK